MRREEKDQCELVHKLIDQYNLKGDFRWIVAQKDRVKNGELYREIADNHGIFAQPALYEAFGLTVMMGMSPELWPLQLPHLLIASQFM